MRVVLRPYTPDPVSEGHQLRVLAEFGIVFLLFTIGLSFSLPQIRALRHQVFALGTGQVALTTAAIGGLAWLAGLPPAAALAVGAVSAVAPDLSNHVITCGFGRIGQSVGHFLEEE